MSLGTHATQDLPDSDRFNIRAMEDAGRGSTRDQEKTEYWRSVLNGEDKGLRIAQQRFGKIQVPPRCKLCRAPFAGPFAPILRLAGFKKWDPTPHAGPERQV